MNLWRLLSCLLRSCWISVSPPATGNVLLSQLWDECSQKKKEGCGVAKDRKGGWGGRKGSGLLFGMKRERVYFNQNEGSIWFAITPQVISWCLKLIASWSRKFWRGFDSWRPQGERGVTREPGMCPVHISHAIHPRQNQTTDVSSCWLHLTNLWPGEEDAEKHVWKQQNTHNHNFESLQVDVDEQKPHICLWSLLIGKHANPLKPWLSSCVKDKSNWPAWLAVPHNAIET